MTMQITRGPDSRFFDGRGSGCSLFERPAARADVVEAFRLGQRHPGLLVDFGPIDAARRAVGYPISADMLSACLLAAERAFDVRRDKLLAPCREAHVTRARFAVMWVLRQVNGWSLPIIRDHLGLGHHTSVRHGLTRAEQLRRTDISFRLLTDAMVQSLSVPKMEARDAR
jgi:hypothetical protein